MLFPHQVQTNRQFLLILKNQVSCNPMSTPDRALLRHKADLPGEPPRVINPKPKPKPKLKLNLKLLLLLLLQLQVTSRVNWMPFLLLAAEELLHPALHPSPIPSQLQTPMILRVS